MSGSIPQLATFANGGPPVLDANLNSFLQVGGVVANLRSFVGMDNQIVYLTGTVSQDDGGAGAMVWNSTATAVDDGVSVIRPYSVLVGAWLRLNQFTSQTTITATTATISGLLNAGTVQAGTIVTAGTTVGNIGLYEGDVSYPGTLAFFNPSGTRVGYIGYSDGAGNIKMETEHGYTGYDVTGNLLVGGSVSVTGTASLAGVLQVSGPSTLTGAVNLGTVAIAGTQAAQWSQILAGNTVAYNSVTGSRVSGVGYTNSASRPIFVSANGGTGSGQAQAYVNGTNVASGAYSGGASALSFIVPIGATYTVVFTGSGAVYNWVEL